MGGYNEILKNSLSSTLIPPPARGITEGDNTVWNGRMWYWYNDKWSLR